MNLKYTLTVTVITLLLIILLITCSNKASNSIIDGPHYYTTIKIIGGCEYVLASRHPNNTAIVHHGACTNPLHHQENTELKHID